MKTSTLDHAPEERSNLEMEPPIGPGKRRAATRKTSDEQTLIEEHEPIPREIIGHNAPPKDRDTKIAEPDMAKVNDHPISPIGNPSDGSLLKKEIPEMINTDSSINTAPREDIRTVLNQNAAGNVDLTDSESIRKNQSELMQQSLLAVKSLHETEIPGLKKRAWNRLVSVASLALLTFGAVSMIESVVLSSSVLAFIGLGLTFWALLLIFVRPSRYARAELVDSTAFSSLQVIDQIVYELGYHGKGIYIPGEGSAAVRLFVPAEKDSSMIPPPEKMGDGLFQSKPKGFTIQPPGLELAKRLREQMGRNPGKLTLEKLKDDLAHILVDRLEVMADFEMEVDGNMIRTKSTGSLYANLCNEVRLKTRVCTAFGCPMCSAIACLLVEATGRAVVLDEDETTPDGHIIKSTYRLLPPAS